AAQARLDGAHDVDARQSLVVIALADLDPAFGRQYETIALSLQPFADDDLGSPVTLRRGRYRVDVGGVDEGDTSLSGAIEDGERRSLIALMAKGHRAKANLRYFQAGAAESMRFHESSPGHVIGTA